MGNRGMPSQMCTTTTNSATGMARPEEDSAMHCYSQRNQQLLANELYHKWNYWQWEIERWKLINDKCNRKLWNINLQIIIFQRVQYHISMVYAWPVFSLNSYLRSSNSCTLRCSIKETHNRFLSAFFLARTRVTAVFTYNGRNSWNISTVDEEVWYPAGRL